MFVYRVFPHLGSARSASEPGHPGYLHPDQGFGRWDNRDRYLTMYLATTEEAAIGETFADRARWKTTMLAAPAVPGAVRRLGVYAFDEEATPLLDLDDPKALAARAIRPSEVVRRNRPHTQSLARAIHDEGVWAGLSWWSMHRPQWTLVALFGSDAVSLVDVVDLTGHRALVSAGTRLGKVVDDDLAGAYP